MRIISDVDTKIGTSNVTSIMLGLFIGGAAVTVALGLLTYNALRSEPLAPVMSTSPPTVTITSPEHGDEASFFIPMDVSASDDSGIEKVFFYHAYVAWPSMQVVYDLIDTDFAAPYESEFDISEKLDHSFVLVAAEAFGNDGSSTMSQHKQVSIDRCYDDNACARVYQNVPFGDRFQQTVTGLQVGSSHSLSFWAKQGTIEVVRVVVTSVDGTQEYGNCEYQINVQPPLFWHNSSCDFVPTSSSAIITLMAGSDADPYDTQYFAYFDNLALSQGTLADPTFTSKDGSWSGTGGIITKGAPPTAIPSFSPNDIDDYDDDGISVISNMTPDPDQIAMVSFYKGWPRATWEFWTSLGVYDTFSNYFQVEHFYMDDDADEVGYYSPLMIYITGMSANPSEFSYEDVVVSIDSDIGTRDVCIPDLSMSGGDVTWEGKNIMLLVDEYGNTYNAPDSPDPDYLHPEYIAKQCLCSDGTVSGQCNASNQYCQGMELQPYRCGSCGVTCPATYFCMSGECCKKVNGVWDCDGLDQEMPVFN